jgi:lysozyme
MNRAALFTAIRPFAPDQRFTPAQVAAIDALADSFGLARDSISANEGIALKPSRAALETIKRFEGCELTAYPDPGSGGDPWTIGWGATGPGIRKGVVWTQEQADTRLREDVERFAEGVAALIKSAPTTQAQFDALTSFSYNVGLGALKESTLLRMHMDGDYSGAAGQFGRWNKASGQVLAGLTKRRTAEMRLYQGLGT